MVVVNVREACGFVSVLSFFSSLPPLYFCQLSYQKAVARLCSVDRYYNLLLVVTNCWECSLVVFRFVLSQDLCK